MTKPPALPTDLPSPGVGTLLFRFLSSSANWCGMLLSTAILLAKAFGLISAYWLPMVIAGYVVGYQVGVLLFGKPSLRNTDLEVLLAPADLNLDLDAIAQRLEKLQQLARNSQRLSVAQGRCLATLCEQINTLLQNMEKNGSLIALEDRYNTRRLALEYLPSLIHGYLTLPRNYTSKARLDGGQTADALLLENLQTLSENVEKMTADLAHQDAEAFLVHTRFLSQKYGRHPAVSALPPDAP